MSPLLRGGLAAAGLAGAFAAGFLLKPVPAARPARAPAETQVALKPPAPAPDIRIPDLAPPPIQDAAVKPATELGSPQAAKPEPPDPLDLAGMAMIRRELGHKTTILDKNEPLPAVLVNAGTSPPVPTADLDIPIRGPAPMGGPMPRLDPPPMPAMPTITLPPPLPPGGPPAAEPAPVPLVNTRAVALDFEVTKSGPSKVTAVELWTTRDGGATWAKTDRMAGCASPFRTRLGSDGEYGFRLVMESESGMRSPEPKAGEKPDLRLVLDTTPPSLDGLAIGPMGGSPDNVRIQWEMFDAHLDAKGVRIEYSTDGRTWHPAGLDSNGPHQVRGGDFRIWMAVWKVPPGLPHRVMLRVTARDQAGNEATAELPKQVSIDLVAPAGKVTGVCRSEAEVGPMPREVDAGADRGPLAEPVRSLLPVLLGSPSVFPPLLPKTAAQPTPWDVSGNDGNPPVELGTPDRSDGIYSGFSRLDPWWEPKRTEAPRLMWTVREWVERLTNTTVVEGPALPPFVRRDPFAVPVVGSELVLAPATDPADWMHEFDHMAKRLPETPEEHARRLDAARTRAACDRPLVPSLCRRAGEQLRPFRETAGYAGRRSLIHHLADPDWKPSTATPDSCRWEPGPRSPRSPFDGAIDVVMPPGRPPAPAVAQGR